MTPARWTPAELVDLQRYPLDDPMSAPYRSLVADCQTSLADSGICLLHEFPRSGALQAMADEAMGLAPSAHRRDYSMAVNGTVSPDLPADHPQRRRHPFRMAAIAYDEFGPNSAIRALYQWDRLTDFIAAVVGGGALYRCADALASCTVTVLAEGDEHGWHYDDNDFVVSLLLQSPVSGGDFEVLPNCRGDGGEDHDSIARAFDGDSAALARPGLRPGTLSLFRGQRSLHHVTRVAGSRPRLIALFSYDRRPGMWFPDEVRRGVYGRLG
jgi:hypothetical protein